LNFDVIIAGAGSVGVPTAMSLAELGIKPLVIDMHPSPGQGENKHAIGGIRATHSAAARLKYFPPGNSYSAITSNGSKADMFIRSTGRKMKNC